ncbi:chlorophyll a-b binding protein [Pseudoscourfieldia marina]
MLARASSLRPSLRAVVRSSSRASVRTSASSRPTWYPGATIPDQLDGTMLGDYGFDPLGLAKDKSPETMAYIQDAELQNGRWAMAAVTGASFTNIVGLPMWAEAGSTANGGYDLVTLALVQSVVMGSIEYKRTYGGGIDVDFMGMGGGKGMALKELVHGRLAMLAFAGIWVQYCVNGMGPIDALKAHIADPGHANIYVNDGGTGIGPFLAVQIGLLAFVPFINNVKEQFQSEDDEPLFEVWKA